MFYFLGVNGVGGICRIRRAPFWWRVRDSSLVRNPRLGRGNGHHRLCPTPPISPIPNPQSPIPNPHFFIVSFFCYLFLIN